ncbi:hypothetical protein RJ641_030330 [Dillenia turbinata]|uniref:SHSP domain-containing protein n=1 Tax=Dillenia turbinata TaxID=194707 RepID=A0AAN8ZH05_9MAGN
MKVHPTPRKRNITLRYDINVINSSLSDSNNRLPCRQKKLRRLPHIFARVLELPFRSDADVAIEETSDQFKFIVIADDIGNNVRAHTVEIYPGVIKIVIRDGDFSVESLPLDELELDLWRFRLPMSTKPEMANAVYSDGELVVTVPKGEGGVEDNDGGIWGEETERLVLVQ